MSHQQIGDMTLDQVIAEFDDGVKPTKRVEDPRTRRKRELFDTVCFMHQMTPSQLADTEPEAVRRILRELDPSLVVDLSLVEDAVKEYVKWKAMHP